MFIYGEKFADSQTQAAEITPKVENVRLIYLKTFFWTKYAQLSVEGVGWVIAFWLSKNQFSILKIPWNFKSEK